jgi:glycosyltransferase involved in cell wall biosynthesis
VNSQPIRVLVVAARFLPELGGVEMHTHEIATRMAHCDDLELTVLTTDRSGRLPCREEFDGFTVLRCKSYPQHRDYYFAPSLYRLVSAGNYDLVHCQGIHTAVPIIAMMAARHRRIPYIVTLHTGGHSSDLRNRLRSLQWRALSPLLRDAAAVVAVSRFEQLLFQKACRLGASRFRIIQNGGISLPGTGRFEKRPGRIVSCGRLERYKGHQRVIEALPILRRSVSNATLHILGSGPYEGKLRALIGELGLADAVTIECVPTHARERMAELLGGAAVVAALSEYEAHPVSVMEALALGTPVVGLDTAGIADLVQSGLVTGVSKDASPAQIAEALLAVLDDSCVDRPAQLPTWDLAAAELMKTYRDAVGTLPRPLHSYDP